MSVIVASFVGEKLIPDQQGLANLETMAKRICGGKDPESVSIVCVMGVAREGKSSLLNMFAEYLSRRGGASTTNTPHSKSLMSSFATGSTTRACTKGISVMPVMSQNRLFLLIDTEGLYHQDNTSEMNEKLMILSTLCSSVLLWNVMATLKSTTIADFSFASRFAASLSGSTQGNPKTPETSSVMPALMFVVRDFQLELDRNSEYHDEKSYLEHALKASLSGQAGSKNKQVIDSLFPNTRRSLVVIPMPLEKDLKEIRAGIYPTSQSKFSQKMECMFTSVCAPAGKNTDFKSVASWISRFQDISKSLNNMSKFDDVSLLRAFHQSILKESLITFDKEVEKKMDAETARLRKEGKFICNPLTYEAILQWMKKIVTDCRKDLESFRSEEKTLLETFDKEIVSRTQELLLRSISQPLKTSAQNHVDSMGVGISTSLNSALQTTSTRDHIFQTHNIRNFGISSSSSNNSIDLASITRLFIDHALKNSEGMVHSALKAKWKQTIQDLASDYARDGIFPLCSSARRHYMALRVKEEREKQEEEARRLQEIARQEQEERTRRQKQLEEETRQREREIQAQRLRQQELDRQAEENRRRIVEQQQQLELQLLMQHVGLGPTYLLFDGYSYHAVGPGFPGLPYFRRY